MPAPKLHGRPHRCASRLLTVLPEGDPRRLREDAVWCQVAIEGAYKGHASGSFDLTTEVFEQLVANFRSHPSYRAGADGYGEADVIPWDFHHESEKRSAELAVVGAPSQAWSLDLEVRQGERGAELWSLTRFLEPALTYVREERYHWSSVAIWPHAVHPVTGEEIGWWLSSIALTNDPFIQGMQPLAAERLLEAGDGLDVDAVMGELRWIFGLSETDGVAEAAAELGKLVAIVSAPDSTPAGVDVDNLIARLRELLRLPRLTASSEVLAQAQELMVRLSTGRPSPAPPAVIEADKRGPEKAGATSDGMNPKLLALVKLLALSATITNEDEAYDAIRAKVEGDKRLLEGTSEARAKLEAIGKLFGVEDPSAVLDKVTGMNAELEQLKAMVPEVAEMLAAQAKSEDEAAEEEVEAAMQAQRMPPAAKPALLTMRTGGIALESRADVLRGDRARLEQLRKDLEARRAQRAKFLQAYPLPKRGQEHLLSRFAAPAPLPASPGAPPAGPPGAAPAPQGLIDLSGFPGRNITEQAMAYVRSQPGGDQLSYDDAWKRACQLNREQQALRMGGLHH